MRSSSQLKAALRIARERHQNQDAVIFHLTTRWVAEPHEFKGDDIVAGWWGEKLTLNIGGHLISMPVTEGEPVFEDPRTMKMVAWGMDRVAANVWTVQPSLHQRGAIHAFIVVQDVPTPAPWEGRPRPEAPAAKAELLAPAAAPPAAEAEEAPPKRCTVCNSTRIGAGACSFLECPDPMFDVVAESVGATPIRMTAGQACRLCPVKFRQDESAFVVDAGPVHPACFWQFQSNSWEQLWKQAHAMLTAAIVSNAGRIMLTPSHIREAQRLNHQFDVDELENGGKRLTVKRNLIEVAHRLPPRAP